MLFHNESAVRDALRTPSVRRGRIARLRSERGFSRFVGLAGVCGAALLAGFDVSSPSPLVPLGAGLYFLYLSSLAESQLHLLLAVDQIEESVARRATSTTVDPSG